MHVPFHTAHVRSIVHLVAILRYYALNGAFDRSAAGAVVATRHVPRGWAVSHVSTGAANGNVSFPLLPINSELPEAKTFFAKKSASLIS